MEIKALLSMCFVVSFYLQTKHPELAFHGAALGLATNVIWLIAY